MAERMDETNDGFLGAQNDSSTPPSSDQMEVNAVARNEVEGTTATLAVVPVVLPVPKVMTPVSCLNEICVVRKLSIPQYKPIGEVGVAHMKIFTMEGYVRDMELRETGHGRTETEANHEAATRLLEKLRRAGERNEGLARVTPEAVKKCHEMLKRFVLTEPQSSVNQTILDLHNDALIAILSHLSFDEVAQMRLVCRRFNDISQEVLNSGFARIQRYRTHCKKEVKDQLPRRESERRIHKLNQHLDILSSIENRLSILSMTYHNNKATCFIPGKVLDECSRVLREVMSSKHELNSSQVLREFRDLCSMAVEHFDEQILPILKRKQKNLMDHPVSSTAFCVNQVLTLGKDQLQAQQNSLPSPSQPTSLSQLETKLKDCEQKCNAQEQQISQLKKNEAEQAKVLKEHSKKWIEWEQQHNPKPAVIAIPVLSKQTAAKSATPTSTSKPDSSQKWLELNQEKQKFDMIQTIPKQPVPGVTSATRSSKPSATASVPLLKAERRACSIALRVMIERDIRSSEVLPLLFGSVTFSVNQSLTIEGIVIPTQVFSSNPSEAVYKENLRFFLKDRNGNTLAASSLYEGLTHRGTLLNVYFKRSLFIQSNRNYVIDLHLSSAGPYPLGVVSTCVSTSEGARFLFGHTFTSNALETIENEERSGLIRGILFSV